MTDAVMHDGTVLRFPDGTPDAVIHGAVQSHLAAERGRADARGKGAATKLVAGAGATLNRALPFADELVDGLSAVGTRLSGGEKTMAQAWARARANSQELADEFRAAHPVASNLTTGAGIALQAVPGFMTGGASVAPALAAVGVKPGMLAGAKQLALRTARAGAVGGVAGYSAGAGGEGTVRQRIGDANVGAGVAAGLSAAFPLAGAAAGAARRAAAPATRTVARAANRAAGGRLLSADREATDRLGEALQKDGATAEQARAILAQWKIVGGPQPALIDVVSQLPSGGQATLGLMRGAAMKAGPARGIAVQHGNQVAVDLQDEAIARTRALTRDRRPAAVVSDELTQAQSNDAATKYRAPYAEQLPLNAETREVLTDEPGLAVLREARADALERRDLAQVAEIDDFLARQTAKPGPVQLANPTPEPPAIQGPAPDDAPGADLSTFLRRQGGVRDPGGELAARDLGRSRSGQFQRGNVTNPNGISLEEAARRALDNGHFPNAKVGDNYHPIDEQDLLDALDRAGRDRRNASWDVEEDAAARARFLEETGQEMPPPAGDDYWASLEAEAPTLSGATLHRTAIALRERAAKFAAKGNNARAGGSFGRKEVLDRALDEAPGLREANASYRNHQAQIDAIDDGLGAMNAAPDTYAAKIRSRVQQSPKARAAAAIGHRQALTDAIGKPTEGAVGTLNRIATSTNSRRNMAESFKPQQAADYRASLRNMIDQVNNARFINPNVGSQTAGRLSDDALVELPPITKSGMLLALIRKIKDGATLTDAEREILLRLGTSKGVEPEQFLSRPTSRIPAGVPRLSPYAAGAISSQRGQ
jgi:hypothetical protein